MIRVTFLGTSAARPTVRRNVSALAIQREGDLLLFDCGEGTQRQMMRFSTGFSMSDVFFTHMHADHFLGIIGLIRTLGLQGRTETLHLFGPKGAKRILQSAVSLGVDRVPFDIPIEELEPGDAVERGEYEIRAFEVRHGTSALGYALEEHARLGRFDVAKARALGIPEGPMFGRLHRGESVEVDGRTITPEELVGSPRAGRKVVYTGDTSPSRDVVAAAAGADLLIHDCTFGAEEEQRARDTHHTTAHGAAKVALDAGARRLVLTHISARYSDNPVSLEHEARAVFPGAVVAHDGLVLVIPYGDGGQEEGGPP